MNRKTMVDAVHAVLQRTGRMVERADVEQTLVIFGDVAAAELLGGGEVPVPGVGKLVTKRRNPRMGRNPRTGQRVQIPARTAVAFRAGKDMRSALEG